MIPRNIKKLLEIYILHGFKPYKTQEERFRNISEWAIDVLKSNNVDEVVLEGYALGSTARVDFSNSRKHVCFKTTT